VYAVIEDSGQQFRVSEGDVLDVDLRELGEETDEITFDRVLLISSDEKVKVGTPLVKRAKVVAEVIDPAAKGEKLHIHRLRRRKASRRRIGHRQKYARVRITKIVGA
jgi:large subunit ribosomal protein L21